MVNKFSWTNSLFALLLTPCSMELLNFIPLPKTREATVFFAIIILMVNFILLNKIVNWLRSGAGMVLPKELETGVLRMGTVIGVIAAILITWEFFNLYTDEWSEGRLYFSLPGVSTMGYLIGAITVRSGFWIRAGFNN